MTRHPQLFWVTILCWLSFAASARVTENFDHDWKFHLGSVTPAEGWAMDTTQWQTITLPHDWSIAGPFAETNQTGGAGAFLPGGIAWYRKDFLLPFIVPGSRVFIEFDGVMQNSDVWINGVLLGHRPSGYVGFDYELTSHLNPGGKNILAVRTDTSAQPASRWYSGGGIYRHVRLVITDPVHFEHDGTFVTTPNVSDREATVLVQVAVTNQTAIPQAVVVQAVIVSPERRMLGSVETGLMMAGGADGMARQQIVLPQPELWSPDSPKLYRAVSKIMKGTNVLDETTTTFGIRRAMFTADSGFVLNGQKLVLKGVCLHEDGGAFGTAVPLGIWEKRLKTLRALGVNAVRTAHNPPAAEFLDLCDRMGFLVMDELFDCWTVGKNQFDYHLHFRDWSERDTAEIVRRDRNHPSVILYSLGNEIHDTRQPAAAIPIARQLAKVCHVNDPTRPVTQALFRPNSTGDYTNGLADQLDVIGTNYRDRELLSAQRDKPWRPIINTEQIHDRTAWLSLRDHPSLSGQFLWTGVDYLGESRRWPRIGHASGLLDRTGVAKPMAFERQSWWCQTPMVRIVRRVAPDDQTPNDPGYGSDELHTQVQFADWTPKNRSPHIETVEAYSNCRDVELFLNGKSLGSQVIHADASPRVWSVPFVPGALTAMAGTNGNVVATAELRTAGPPARIHLETTDPTLGRSWDDVSIIRAMVTDSDGTPVPQSDDLISFSVNGPGIIAAVDNGDNDSHEPFQASQRHGFHGTCTVFIKADGRLFNPATTNVVITARASGLSDDSVTLNILPQPND